MIKSTWICERCLGSARLVTLEDGRKRPRYKRCWAKDDLLEMIAALISPQQGDFVFVNSGTAVIGTDGRITSYCDLYERQQVTRIVSVV